MVESIFVKDILAKAVQSANKSAATAAGREKAYKYSLFSLFGLNAYHNVTNIENLHK